MAQEAAVPLPRVPTDLAVTDRVLALMPFPDLPGRSSQRQSAGRTKAANPRTFEELQVWDNFSRDAMELAAQLDDEAALNPNVHQFLEDEGLPPAANEVGVHGAMADYLFPQVNKLAPKIGLKFKLRCGGSGRSFSCTDLVVLDPDRVQDMANLSSRVYANGEAKGPWQWEMAGSSFIEELGTKKQAACIEVLQQLFGDMVMDETRYGFLTNYNQTVFVRRNLSNSKCLDVAPVVSVDAAPVAHFLSFLQHVERDKGSKQAMDRLAVQETPPRGLKLRLPPPAAVQNSTSTSSTYSLRKRKIHTPSIDASKRQRGARVFEAEQFGRIPPFPMVDVGITGCAIGLAKYGNVLEGSIHGHKAALKCFDMRHDLAADSFVQEQKIYSKLQDLQGLVIPRLLAIGRLPHLDVYYLALSFEGHSLALDCAVAASIWQALRSLHEQGVIHGDLNRSHILQDTSGQVKLIDFDQARLEATREEQQSEVKALEELLSAWPRGKPTALSGRRYQAYQASDRFVDMER